MNAFLLKTLAATAAVFAITASAHADPFGNSNIFKKSGGSIFRSGNISDKPHLPNLGSGGFKTKMPGPIANIPKGPKFPKLPSGSGGGSGGGSGEHHHHGGAGWVLGALTILASDYDGCGYEYYKWKSTGSGYWRERYHDCRDFE